MVVGSGEPSRANSQDQDDHTLGHVAQLAFSYDARVAATIIALAGRGEVTTRSQLVEPFGWRFISGFPPILLSLAITAGAFGF
jgi:hypothetical protein